MCVRVLYAPVSRSLPLSSRVLLPPPPPELFTALGAFQSARLDDRRELCKVGAYCTTVPHGKMVGDDDRATPLACPKEVPSGTDCPPSGSEAYPEMTSSSPPQIVVPGGMACWWWSCLVVPLVPLWLVRLGCLCSSRRVADTLLSVPVVGRLGPPLGLLVLGSWSWSLSWPARPPPSRLFALPACPPACPPASSALLSCLL